MPDEHLYVKLTREGSRALLDEYITLYQKYGEIANQRILRATRLDDLVIVYEQLRMLVGYLELVYGSKPE